MSEATFKVGPYTGTPCRWIWDDAKHKHVPTGEVEMVEPDDAYRNTLVKCSWCGAGVRWLALGDHMEGHHTSQRIYRPLPSCKKLSPADAVRVSAECQGQDATDEEVKS